MRHSAGQAASLSPVSMFLCLPVYGEYEEKCQYKPINPSLVETTVRDRVCLGTCPCLPLMTCFKIGLRRKIQGLPKFLETETVPHPPAGNRAPQLCMAREKCPEGAGLRPPGGMEEKVSSGRKSPQEEAVVPLDLPRTYAEMHGTMPPLPPEGLLMRLFTPYECHAQVAKGQSMPAWKACLLCHHPGKGGKVFPLGKRWNGQKCKVSPCPMP